MIDMSKGPKANPLAQLNLVDGVARRDGHPVPLVGERMRIVIRGGLALISREQVFRNVEDSTIEATVTFPVPIHATLCRLAARIDDRTLVAAALPRHKARDTYEVAIDDGKTAVLHEELVRGIHMLSIAHIPPGSEVAVTHTWISALSPRGVQTALLRVPVTLGDVYGDSPFSDADDLTVSRSVVHAADVEIDAGTAAVALAGHSLVDGKTKVRLDAPIDIELTGPMDRAVGGISADGRRVSVSVVPDIGGDAGIDAAILVDRSGSMGETASWSDGPTGRNSSSKHGAVVVGLAVAGLSLEPRDRAELWQFDSTFERLSSPGLPLIEVLQALGKPRGGTEIGAALRGVVATSSAGDIILITDGLSHALDVQALANSGRRFTVVLVGENSLEANVGRLAALTGGQIVLAAGAADASAAVRRAIDSVRRPRTPFEVGTWPLEKAVVHAGGATVEARWGVNDALTVEPAFAVAVGALAAAMAIPCLREDQAVKVTVDHGIVCHLTSLVLVDDAGATLERLPTQRKVPLMRSRCSIGPDIEFKQRLSIEAPLISSLEEVTPLPALRRWQSIDSAPTPTFSLSEAAKRIDWDADPEALQQGDLTGLPPELAARIAEASRVPEVGFLAKTNRSPVAIVIALMAKSIGGSNRAATRIARAVLRGLDLYAIANAMAALGL
jgi:hypothetical protein